MSRKRTQNSSRRCLALAVCSLLPLSSVRANTPATWTAAGNGSWTTASNWSTNPNFPNNGTPVGANYDVVIGTGTVSLSANPITVNSISLSAGAGLTVNSALSATGAAGIALGGGTLTFDGASIKNTLISDSGGGTIYAGGFTTTLNNVAFSNVNFTIGEDFSTNTVQITSDLSLNNSVMTLGNGAVSNSEVFDFIGDDTISGSGQFVFNGAGPESFNHIESESGTFTTGSGITIRTGTSSGDVNRLGMAFINEGTISAQTSGQFIDVYNVTNSGTLLATNGGTLNLKGTVSNPTGTIQVNNGTLNLGGTDTLGTLGTFVRTGGTVNYIGTLNNSGKTLDLASTPAGTLNIGAGALVNGGTLFSSSSAFIPTVNTYVTYANGLTATFSGVTLASNFTIAPASTLIVQNGMTLASGAIISIAGTNANLGFSLIQLSGTQVLGGAGVVSFDGNSQLNSIGATSGTLTIGPGVTIRTGAGSGSVGVYNGSLINQGILAAQTAGQTLTIGAASWTNTGTLRTDAGVLNLGGAFTTAGMGNIVRTGGSIQISGALDNTGATLNLDALGPIVLNNGSISGGTITGSTANPITVLAAGSDSAYIGGNSTIAATINVAPGGQLKLKDGITLNGATVNLGQTALYCFGPLTVSGTGQFLVAGNSPSVGASIANVTFGAGITIRNTAGATGDYTFYSAGGINNGLISSEVSGQTISVFGGPSPFTNNGTIRSLNGGALSLDSVSNAGTISAVGGALQLSDLSTNTGMITVTNTAVTVNGTNNLSVFMNFSRSGGTVTFIGTYNNSGNTFDMASTGQVLMQGAVINGGSIISSTGANLVVAGATPNILSGVSVAANVTINATQILTVTNNLSLSSGTINLTGSAFSNTTTTLNFFGAQTLGGTGAIEFDGVGPFSTLSGDALTIGPGISITTGISGAGTVGTTSAAPIKFQGTAQPGTGGTLTFAFVNNTGTITAPAGTTVAFNTINNNGTVKTTGGIINLGGTFVLANLGNLANAGGTINITGVLNNTGTTLSTDPAQNPWGISGGQINGGTVASPLNIFGPGTSGTLNGVTLSSATVTILPSATLAVTGGLTLSNGIIDLLGAPISFPSTFLKFSGTQTLSGTGTIQFDGNTAKNSVQPTTTLTLPSGISVITGVSGGAFSFATGNGLINNGLLSAQTNAQTLAVSTSTFTNNASAQAINGSTLSLTATNWTNAASGVITINGSTFTTGGAWTNAGTINVINGSTANIGGSYTAAALGSISFTGNDTVNLSGTLDNSANTLTFGGISGSVNLAGVTINGGALSLNGTPPVSLLNATLSGVTIDASTTLTLPAGSTLTTAGTWANQGTITAVAPGVNQTPATLNLGGTFTLASLGTLNTAAATLNLTGSLTLASSETLPLNSTLGSWNLNGGAIHGGTISVAGPQFLHIQSGTLDGVHITGGDFNEDGAAASLAILNGITVDNENFDITGSAASVKFDGPSQTIDNLTIDAMATTAGAQQMLFLGGATSTSAITVTLGAAATLRGNLIVKNNPSHSGNTLINNGTISADTPAQTLAISPSNFTNNATAKAINGSILTINATNWTNASTGTISASASTITLGGTWTNAGTISLTNASILNLGGTFTVLGLGSINISPDSTVNITGTLDNAAGGDTTKMLNLNSSTGSWSLATGGILKNGTILTASGQQLNLSGGTLSGASLSAGSTIGVANSTGNWTGTSTESGTIGANNAILNLGKSIGDHTTIGTSGAINATSSALAILGSFTNQGAIAVSGTSTINGSISNTGMFSAAGVLSGSIHLTNSGTVLIGGIQQWNSGSTLTNTAGTASFTSDAGSAASTLSIVASGGSVSFSSTQHLAGLTIHNGAAASVALPATHAARSVIVTGSLGFDGALSGWQGKLDLSGNDLIVKSGSVTNISNQLKSGLNAPGDYWNGTAGISSLAAAGDSHFLTALGFRTGGMAFDGVNTTSADVLVKYTYYGDADLSGTVDGADYQQIDHGLGSHLTGWSNGDFNYDGVVDGSDYALIDNTFNQLAATGASPLALLADAGIAQPVPEPIAAGFLIGGIVFLARRRRNPGQS